ncbi:PDR/VanB family oxidoreductase [Pelomonas sp. KK5]|uniref:PDR/VanB family oxidoreductase n=1 Tax=Pelomonas sp. KK5 TaxID=1855730 RepID=UPI00097BD644|nr:PDR/VanB family oxidoreductase [Pelomonas sp. KK5]
MPDSATPSLLTVRVLNKRIEAQGICSLELVAADGRQLPAFSAGAHIDLHLPNGLVRQYSLCNAPDERQRYLVAVLRDPNSRGGSAAVHEQLEQGDVLQISEPRNHFQLVPTEHAILLGGGIGITPILCMAERLAQTHAQFEMHYCTREPACTAFQPRIAASSFAERVSYHHDNGSPEQKLDARVTLGFPETGKHLFVCGPQGFMDWVIGTARELGWAEGNIHREYFAAAAVDTSADDGFQIKIASTGAVLMVQKDQAVTQVMEAHGVSVAISCEQGVCGTCLTRVLEGNIDHRDVFLTDAERARNDQFTPCVSRAQPGCRMLVLDL